MAKDDSRKYWTTRTLISVLAVIAGSLVLRSAATTMGQMLQFYFATIDRNYFHISYSVRGYVTASFFITELIGSPLLGAMSDRYGQKRFILLGPIFGAVAVQITAMTTAIWLLIGTRLLEGLSTGSSIPATLGYISEVTKGRPNLRARVIGLFEITFIGGIAIGAVLGGYLWKDFGSPVVLFGLRVVAPAFSLNAIVYLLSLAIFWWGLHETKNVIWPETASDAAMAPASTEHLSDSLHSAHGHVTFSHYVRLLKSPPVWKFVPAWLAVNSIIGMWTNHSVGLLTGKDHFSRQLLMGRYRPEGFGRGFALFSIVFATGVFVWSLFVGKYKKTSAMLVATGGVFATLAVTYGLNHLDAMSGPAFFPLMAGFILGLLVMSGFTPAALIYLADISEHHREDRGTIMGLYTFLLGIGQVIGTVLGGFFAGWRGVDGLLILSFILACVTLTVVFSLHRNESAQPVTIEQQA